MELRDLLMELYITHGDRDFIFNYAVEYEKFSQPAIRECIKNVFSLKQIPDADGKMLTTSYITSKGMELIKGNKWK